MSPETIVPTKVEDVDVDDLVNNKDYKMPDSTCMAATGQCFSVTNPGIIPRLIADLYKERSTIKKDMLKLKREKADDKDIAKLDTKQLALKILMNTLDILIQGLLKV